MFFLYVFFSPKRSAGVATLRKGSSQKGPCQNLEILERSLCEVAKILENPQRKSRAASLNRGVSNRGVSRSGLVLPFFVPFCSFLGTFPIFSGFFPICPGIFPSSPFPLVWPISFI